jgi:nicotinate-nucleotide adenylyltransferase
VAQLANLVVVQRPGHSETLGPEMRRFTDARVVESLNDCPAGGVLMVRAEMLPISAAQIRERLMSGKTAAHLLPGAVATYIREHNLYGVVSDP